MPQVMVARVTCPNCHTQFQTPVEQILDVKADPDAKMRVLNGLVNIAICPNCRAGGGLNLPFVYHDPEKELALVYMPMEAGRTDLERQQGIGKLTSAVMNSLPAEQRKGYLLQPQVFLTLENLTNRILEADGVTPEMIEAQKAKADLLRRMLEATSEEVLAAMIKENDASIDADLFAMLNMNLEVVQSTGQAAGLQRLLALRNKLLEASTEGRAIKARGEAVEALRAEPSREKMLDLLVGTADEHTRELLIAFGRPLLDYPFFQALTSRIEATADESERDRLTALRTEILAVRDRLDEGTRALLEERGALLRDIMLSDDPEAFARRRFRELDQAFFNVLAANMREAEEAGNEELVKSLQAVWALILRLEDETLPPELRLFNRLMGVESDADVEKLLEANRAVVTEHFIQFLEEAESNIRAKPEEEGAAETADRLARILAKAKMMVVKGN